MNWARTLMLADMLTKAIQANVAREAQPVRPHNAKESRPMAISENSTPSSDGQQPPVTTPVTPPNTPVSPNASPSVVVSDSSTSSEPSSPLPNPLQLQSIIESTVDRVLSQRAESSQSDDDAIITISTLDDPLSTRDLQSISSLTSALTPTTSRWTYLKTGLQVLQLVVAPVAIGFGGSAIKSQNQDTKDNAAIVSVVCAGIAYFCSLFIFLLDKFCLPRN